MKKITFILLALVSGASFAQVSTTAAVNAEIVSTIKISGSSALEFGKIVADPAGGNVRVSPGGDRTYSNSKLKFPGEDIATAAEFKVTAAAGGDFNIYVPDIVLVGPAESDDMSVSFDYENTGNGGDGTEQILKIGGVLSVNNNQMVGPYTGTVRVTVAYQ